MGKRSRVPGQFSGEKRFVSTLVVCDVCGVHGKHVEFIAGDDHPDGVPEWLACRDCDTGLMVPRG